MGSGSNAASLMEGYSLIFASFDSVTYSHRAEYTSFYFQNQRCSCRNINGLRSTVVVIHVNGIFQICEAHWLSPSGLLSAVQTHNPIGSPTLFLQVSPLKITLHLALAMRLTGIMVSPIYLEHREHL